ncbi:MAG TPA: hypothetical protein ENN41_06220 [Sediminispirochaeta sp.]|nr:hypothetical protein [Sediminispirochaeta sp.]
MRPRTQTTPRATREIPMEELRTMARSYVPEEFLFLCDEDHEPLSVFQDLDGNGLEDIFFLLVEKEGLSEPPERTGRVQAERLSDMGRLFAEGTRPLSFYLALFLRNPQGLVSMYRIPVGRWFVFEGMRGFSLDRNEEMPYCVELSFQTHDGAEKQWVCFSKFNQFSFAELVNGTSISTEYRDIDDDGLLDIVEWRRLFEDGTGFETYLTWYRWDGVKFTQKASTNIVRNLNDFLGNLSRLMVQGKWEEVLALADLPDSLSPTEGPSAETSSPASVVRRLFPPEAEGNGTTRREDPLLDAFTEERRFLSMVFFPRILENPFYHDFEKGVFASKKRFPVRFLLRNGEKLLRECVVGMNENPFAEPQFFLLLPQ